MGISTEEKALLENQGIMVTVGEDGSLTVAFEITRELERFMKIKSLSFNGADTITAEIILTLASRKLVGAENVVKVYNSNQSMVSATCDCNDDALLEIPNISPTDENEVLNEIL